MTDTLVNLLLPYLGIFAVIVPALAMVLMRDQQGFNDPSSPAFFRRLRLLSASNLAESYYSNLKRAQLVLARLIGEVRFRSSNHDIDTVAEAGDGKCWSAASYGFCFSIAFLYPVMALIAFWIVYGCPSAVGSLTLLPGTDVWTRLAALLYSLVGGAALWFFARSDRFSGLIKLIGAAVATAIFPMVLAHGPAVVVSGTLALGIALVARSNALLAGGVLGTLLGAVAASLAGHLVLPIHHALSALVSTIVFLAVWVAAVRLTLTTSRRFADRSAPAIFWMAINLGTVGLTILAIRYLSTIKGFEYLLGLVFFFCLLPFVNAFWDWLSLGLTRWCLKHLSEDDHQPAHVAGWMLVDILGSLTIGIAVALSLVLLGSMIDRVLLNGGGTAQLGTETILVALHVDYAAPTNFWLYTLLVSVLIPTLVHITFVAMVIVVYLRRTTRVRAWLVRLRKGLGKAYLMRNDPFDSDLAHQGAVALFLVRLSWVLLPIFLLLATYLMLRPFLGPLGRTVLGWSIDLNWMLLPG